MAGSAAGRSAVPAAPATAAPPPWKPGDVVMKRYRIIDVMSGSMGHVYICEHLGWGVKMAIKSPRPEVIRDAAGMRMILAEAEAWTGLGMHPNIACCYYVLTLDEIPRIFIEYVDGGNLAEWIKAGRCRDLRTAINLAVQFCHGMEYTHANGIIHRDIKPQNILLTKNALLKITDFGIILRKEMRAGGQGFRGTPAYASPEQFRSAADLGPASDIFSFGICLWLMLCGRRPFKRNDMNRTSPRPPRRTAAVFPVILPISCGRPWPLPRKRGRKASPPSATAWTASTRNCSGFHAPTPNCPAWISGPTASTTRRYRCTSSAIPARP